jgi:putative glutamine amidotransferase
MRGAPFVIVTATTEVIRGVSRVRVNEAYTNALAAVGLLPVVLPPIDAALAVGALAGAGGLVLTGGEDIDPAAFGQPANPATGVPHHARDSYELALARAAFEGRVPTLAICRGAQIVNVALGGTLIQDIPTQCRAASDHDPQGKRADRTHDVLVEPRSLLGHIVGGASIRTNSSHHQAADTVPSRLRVTASSPDGIVEALEPNDPAWWMVAVQWHPEELTATAEEWDRRIFSAFAEAVRAAARD